MSSNNGIYMLETKGNEFRVALLDNIEEIYEKNYQSSGKFRMISLYSFFVSCEIFYSHEQALEYAKYLSEECGYTTEHGICYIDANSVSFPESMPDCCSSPHMIKSYGTEGEIDFQECHNCGYFEELEELENT